MIKRYPRTVMMATVFAFLGVLVAAAAIVGTVVIYVFLAVFVVASLVMAFREDRHKP